MKSVPTKRFRFSFEIEAPIYSPETANELYGGIYDSSYPESIEAYEIASQLIQGAYCDLLERKIDYLSECGCEIKDMTASQKAKMEYLQERINVAKRATETLQLVRVEK